MLLSGERHERVTALGYDYEAQPKHLVERCNLCGSDRFMVVARRDRYGFPAEARCCRRCGLVFLSPVLTEEAYGEFYREVYRPLVSAYHGRLIDAETIEAEQAEYAAALVALLEPFLRELRGAALLDVGGSTGVVAGAVADRFGLAPTVLDPAPAEAERAAERGIEAIVGTIEEAELGGRRFDVILLCQTIDHLLDVAGSLAKLGELLAPGGLFFVDIVDFRRAYLRTGNAEEAVKIDHPYSLTEATAEAFLARTGFEILHTDYPADELHVGYVCRRAEARPDALPPTDSLVRLLRELQSLRNAPEP